MQKSLFHAQNNSDKSVVTDGDSYIGKSYGNLPHVGFNDTSVPSVNLSPEDASQNHAGAVILVADLERRGVSLRAENGIIVCIGDSAVIDRFSLRIVEHKSALLKLLGTEAARCRVMPELRRMMPDDDVVAIGRLLLKLDNGEEIE